MKSFPRLGNDSRVHLQVGRLVITDSFLSPPRGAGRERPQVPPRGVSEYHLLPGKRKDDPLVRELVDPSAPEAMIEPPGAGHERPGRSRRLAPGCPWRPYGARSGRQVDSDHGFGKGAVVYPSTHPSKMRGRALLARASHGQGRKR